MIVPLRNNLQPELQIAGAPGVAISIRGVLDERTGVEKAVKSSLRSGKQGDPANTGDTNRPDVEYSF